MTGYINLTRLIELVSGNPEVSPLWHTTRRVLVLSRCRFVTFVFTLSKALFGMVAIATQDLILSGLTNDIVVIAKVAAIFTVLPTTSMYMIYV